MTSISRVILDKETSSQSGIGTAGANTFSIGNKIFYRFDEPSTAHIDAASSAMKIGLTAGIFRAEILRPSAIFFDMDGTVIQEESLVEIARVAGRDKEIGKLTNMAMSGQMGFSESLTARLSILKGITRNQVLAIRPTISRGMEELTHWCRSQGIKIFLISGGFTELAEPVSRQLGFDDFQANRFAWGGDVMLGHAEGPIIDATLKQKIVLDWCSSHGLNPKNTLAVGDGANDVLMMRACGGAVGYCPKPILWNDLQIANHTADHHFLLESLR